MKLIIVTMIHSPVRRVHYRLVKPTAGFLPQAMVI